MLDNCNILVSRPKDQADDLIAQLQKVKANVTHIPMLQIKPLATNSWLSTLQQNFSDSDYIIFTSKNAVINSLPHLNNACSKLTAIAMGEATKQSLQPYKFKKYLVPEKNFSSNSLLLMPELQMVNDKKIVIVTGKNGLGTLAPTLKERGAKVTNIECYERLVPQFTDENINLAKTIVFDYVIATSNETLANIGSLFAKANITNLNNAKIVAISRRISEIISKLKLKNKLVLAENASDLAITQAIIADWIQV